MFFFDRVNKRRQLARNQLRAKKAVDTNWSEKNEWTRIGLEKKEEVALWVNLYYGENSSLHKSTF